MDPEVDFAAPVRPGSRKRAPLEPDDITESWEDPGPFYSIVFDAGSSATGWSVFGVWPEAMHDPTMKILDHLAFWSAGEFTGSEAQITDQCQALIAAWPEEAWLMSEDFILQKFTMARDLLSPVRLNARLEDRIYVAYNGRRTLHYQANHIAFRTVTDERLKVWGFWNILSGQKDARQSVQHNITWLRRLKERFMKEIAAEAKRDSDEPQKSE